MFLLLLLFANIINDDDVDYKMLKADDANDDGVHYMRWSFRFVCLYINLFIIICLDIASHRLVSFRLV